MVDDAKRADPDNDGQVQDAAPAAQPSNQTPPAGPVVPRVPPPPGSSRIPAADASPRPARDAAPPRRRGGAFRRFLTLLLLVLTGLAIGLMLWLIVPPVFQSVVDPLAENNAAVASLQAQFDALRNEQNAALNEQRSALIEAQEETTGRLAAAEERLAAAEARLRDVEDMAAAQGRQIAELGDVLGETTSQLEAATAQLDALEAELPGVAEYDAFNRQLMLIRAWQDGLKARLRLFENNAGLAEEDLSRALETLRALYAVSTPEQQAELDPVLDRMEAALVAVQEMPFTASADLEVAWYALGELIQPVSIEAATPEADAEPTPEGEDADEAAPADAVDEATPTPTPAGPTPTPGA